METNNIKTSSATENSKLLTQIEEKITRLEREAQNQYNAEQINGTRIANDKIELYKKLIRLKELLNTNETNPRQLFIFNDLYTTLKDYKEVMELINDKDLELDINDNLKLYGNIPGYSTLTGEPLQTPRPLKKGETYEHYEQFLTNYYKNSAGFEAKKDENGRREPYPHEKFKWENKRATSYPEGEYSPYYNHLFENLAQERTSTQETHEETTSQTSTRRQYYTPESQPQPNHSTRQTAGTGRYRMKSRTPLKEHLKNLKSKIFNLNYAAGNDEAINSSIKAIKRIGCIALIIAGGFIACKFILPSLIGPIIKAIGLLPKGIATALTGSGLNASGIALSAAQISGIREKLIQLVLALGGAALVLYLAKHHRKKAKKQEQEQEQTPDPTLTTPPTSENIPPTPSFDNPPTILIQPTTTNEQPEEEKPKQKSRQELLDQLRQIKEKLTNLKEKLSTEEQNKLLQEEQNIIEQITNNSFKNGGISL